MERAPLHLLVILLASSHLITAMNAVPSTRNQKLLQETQGLPALGDAHQAVAEEGLLEEVELINGRMDLENNDYPGSGANNRHTPKPPGKN